MNLPTKVLVALATACAMYLIVVAGYVIFNAPDINVGPIHCADCPPCGGLLR